MYNIFQNPGSGCNKYSLSVMLKESPDRGVRSPGRDVRSPGRGVRIQGRGERKPGRGVRKQDKTYVYIVLTLCLTISTLPLTYYLLSHLLLLHHGDRLNCTIVTSPLL